MTQIDRVVEAVEETLKGNVVHMLAKKKLPRLDLPKVSPPPLQAPQTADPCAREHLPRQPGYLSSMPTMNMYGWVVPEFLVQ